MKKSFRNILCVCALLSVLANGSSLAASSDQKRAAAVATLAPPQKEQTYASPSFDNIMRSLVRFEAIDVEEDAMVDIFARVNACDVFHQYYKDEFKWHEIRAKMREIIKSELATYPTGYRYDTTLKLGRYDFEKRVYPFDKQALNSNVNAFRLTAHDSDFCDNTPSQNFPKSFRFVLGEPINVPSLPLSEQEAIDLVKRMDNDRNLTHLVFARFKLRVKFIAEIVDKDQIALLKRKQEENKEARVKQLITRSGITIDSQLDAIEFYEDEARTKLIYIYRP